MRVLIDTDVILDVLLARTPFVTDAAAIWLANEQGRLEGYISAITPINVFYIVGKAKGIAVARQSIGELLSGWRICPADEYVLQAAYALPMNDFEDAAQVAAAQAAGLDVLVTRNTSDYANAPLLVLTPADLIKQLPAP